MTHRGRHTCQNHKVLREDSSGNLQGTASGGKGLSNEAPPLGVLIKDCPSPACTHLHHTSVFFGQG